MSAYGFSEKELDEMESSQAPYAKRTPYPDSSGREHIHVCPMHSKMTVWHCFKVDCLLPEFGHGAATCPTCLGRLQEMAYGENARRNQEALLIQAREAVRAAKGETR